MGVTSLKNTLILIFDFHPYGALEVHWIKKLHKTKSHQRLILVGVPFKKNFDIARFWLPPWPVLPSVAVFSPLDPKIKILLPTNFLPCPPVSKKVWHRPLAPNPWEEIDLAETPFWGVWAWPRGPQGPIHPPKNYLQGVKLNLKFGWDLATVSKIISLCQTDRQTNTH